MKSREPYTVIYEDSCIIVVNKSAGVSVGGDRWDDTALRLDRLLARESPVFTVHRIDRDTSGLVVFARDRESHRSLSLAFENRQAGKEYLAAVHGRPGWEETECRLPLVIDGDKRHRTIVDRGRGKEARTCFRRLLSAGNYSFIEARPETGRTHQIRVHLAALGFPVICDTLYGRSANSPHNEKGMYLSSFKKGWRGDPAGERPLIERLALHAFRLSLPCPDGGGVMRFEAPLPRDMRALKSQMEKSRKEPLTGGGGGYYS